MSSRTELMEEGVSIPFQKMPVEPTILRIAANGKLWDVVLHIATLRLRHFPEKDRDGVPHIKMDNSLVMDVKEVHEQE